MSAHCNSRQLFVRCGRMTMASVCGGCAHEEARGHAALLSCAPLTVGEVVYGPYWYAQGGIGEAPEGALKAEPGERFVDLFGILKGDSDEKEVCQNTAKNNPASRMLEEDRTAEYMRFLGSYE